MLQKDKTLTNTVFLLYELLDHLICCKSDLHIIVQLGLRLRIILRKLLIPLLPFPLSLLYVDWFRPGAVFVLQLGPDQIEVCFGLLPVLEGAVVEVILPAPDVQLALPHFPAPPSLLWYPAWAAGS